MLETLVSSRIRRTLFEYVLAHPTDRFYLRGLAKDLGLSVSPLRREIKRLEHSGALQAEHEGNILFYTVNAQAPVFLQLQQASLPAPAVSLGEAKRAWAQAGLPGALPATSLEAVQVGERTKAPSPLAPHPAELGVGFSVSELPDISARPIVDIAPGPRASRWSSPLSSPLLVGAAGLGMGLVLIIATLAYLTMTNHRIVSQASNALSGPKAAVTVVMPSSTPSGVMRGTRWQVVPGGFGGFSSGASHDSY